MGALGTLLIPALGGYIFITTFNSTRDRARHQSGYHVVFQSAIVGVLLFAASHVLLLLGTPLLDAHLLGVGAHLVAVVLLWQKAFSWDYSATAAVALFLGSTLPLLLNLLVNLLEARRRNAELRGDHIGLVIDEALTEPHPVEISLSSRKAYVGFPLRRTFRVGDETGDLVLLPIWSGYRDNETLGFKRMVNYVPVIWRTVYEDQEKRIWDLRIAIPMAEVLSARPFDMNTHRCFLQEIADNV